ncbi:MAG: DUF192 domain-containing protein [Oceanicaulis sp.]|nr:DUF192 domain-containing protein [Oceanicaulis sp.]
MMIGTRILALAAAALVGFGSAGCALAQSIDPTAPDAIVEYGGPDPLTIEGDFGSHTFTVEVANTDDSRERGLMHRESMDPDAGMLFDFGREDFISIWMENTIIPRSTFSMCGPMARSPRSSPGRSRFHVAPCRQTIA